MTTNQKTASLFRRLSGVVAVLCIGLVLLCGTLQVTHAHEASGLPDSLCALCATAHLVIGSSAPVVTPMAMEQVSVVQVAAGKIAISATVNDVHTIRPPPVVNYSA